MKTSEDSTHLIDTPVHRSFILRCWVSPEGETRIRLINTQTNQQYVLSSLEELAILLERLTEENPASLGSNI